MPSELTELVTAQLAGGTVHLTTDVSGLSFADSASVSAGARSQDLEGARRRLGAAASAARVARMLEITGADQMITVRGETEITPEPEPKDCLLSCEPGR